MLPALLAGGYLGAPNRGPQGWGSAALTQPRAQGGEEGERPSVSVLDNTEDTQPKWKHNQGNLLRKEL